MCCFSSVNFEDSTEVLHDQEALLIHPNTSLTISWDPISLVPTHIENPDQYLVNICLVRFTSDGHWVQVAELVRGYPNTGEATVSIPSLVDGNQLLIQDIQPVAIQVRVGESQADPRFQSQTLIQQLEDKAKLWTAPLYYSLNNNFRQKCLDWWEMQPENIGEDIISELRACPPLVQRARRPNSGLVEDSGISRLRSNSFFHRGTTTCFRSREARSVTDYHSWQYVVCSH